jgi:hypothetical protein
MSYVVFQISVATMVHIGHGDDDHGKAMVMKIIRSSLLHGDENHPFFASPLQITHPSSEAKRRR